MSESDEGVRVAATRQKAGTSKPAAPCPPGAAPGGANRPAGTASAAVILALGKAVRARVSQETVGSRPPRGARGWTWASFWAVTAVAAATARPLAPKRASLSFMSVLRIVIRR